MVRIDDRLIHGQVITVWCKHKPFSKIASVDDGVAADSFMQEVLGLAAPPGLTVEVYSVDEALQALGPDTPRETTMVLMKSPETARRLYDGGLGYKELNIGGIGSAPGRKNIFKNISASKEQIETLKYLLAEGVEITLLTVPGEKSKNFRDLADKL